MMECILKRAALVTFLLIGSSAVWAEYRVYQYFVKSKMELPYDAQSYVTLSTFDPVSFVAYHGGAEAIKVDLLNTWMCKGNTAGQDYCASPYEESERAPSQAEAKAPLPNGGAP